MLLDQHREGQTINLMNTRLAKLKEKITAQRKHLDELENHMYVSLLPLFAVIAPSDDAKLTMI